MDLKKNSGIFLILNHIKRNNMIEYILIGVLLAIIIVMIFCWPKIEKIEDTAPKNPNPVNNWLKLQNEGGKHVKVKDGKVYIKIVK